MGREASVSYFTSEAKKCACSLFAGEKDNCCDDKQGLLKLEDSQKNIKPLEISVPSLAFVREIFESAPCVSNAGPSIVIPFATDDGPPPRILFKIHCSYVFYDDKSVA